MYLSLLPKIVGFDFSMVNSHAWNLIIACVHYQMATQRRARARGLVRARSQLSTRVRTTRRPAV